MKINIINKVIFGLLLVYFFLVFDTRFHGPDEPLYFAYTESIVQDLDLNIVNNIDYTLHPFYLVAGKKEISPTDNLPDYHAHGGVIFWAPFYLYAKTAGAWADKVGLKSIVEYGLGRLTACAMSFSTILFGFLTIILTYFLCREFFSAKISMLSNLAVLFGTPFFYFVLYETANAQIIAALLSVISIYFLLYAARMHKWQWFFYGLFFSICAAVKYDLWFQVFSISILFIYLVLFKRVDWKKSLYFTAGILPGMLLKVINDYIKYGSFHQGELGLLNFNSFYFLEQLFSPYHGFVYTSPLFYICFFGLILLLLNLFKHRADIRRAGEGDIFIFIISLSLFVKIFFMSFRYAWGGGTPGARPLLPDYSIFVLLYAYAFRNQKKLTKYFLIFLSVLFIFWNLIVISEFIAKVDIPNLGKTIPLAVRIGYCKYLYPLFLIKDLGLKTICLPLLAVCGGAFLFFSPLKNNGRMSLPGPLICLAAYCFLSYTLVTAINLKNNALNSEKLKQSGFFCDARVISSRDFENLENNSSVEEMIDYYRIIGDKGRVSALEKIKNQFYNNY